MRDKEGEIYDEEIKLNRNTEHEGKCKTNKEKVKAEHEEQKTEK